MFKIKSSILIVLSIGFLLNGCANRSYVMNEDGEVVKSLSLNLNANGAYWYSEYEYPIKDHGVIVFFRRAFGGDYVIEPEKLYVNGKFLTDMKQYGVYPFHVKPGKYTFTIGSPNPQEVLFKDTQVLSGELKAGELFYVELKNKKLSSGTTYIDAAAYFSRRLFYDILKIPDVGFSAYKQSDSPLLSDDYRLSATKKRDVMGLSRLKKENDTTNSSASTRKNTLENGASGMLEGVKKSAENNGADILKNGLAGAVVLAIPTMIKNSATEKNDDDYLEYIGTRTGYTMDYLFDE